MPPPCIYKDYNIIKRVTLAYIVITIIGNYYMSFFGYSYFTINIEKYIPYLKRLGITCYNKEKLDLIKK